MKIKYRFNAISQIGIGLTAIAFLLAGCSGGSSSSSSAGGGSGGSGSGTTTTGVSTPSKVSVVNTN